MFCCDVEVERALRQSGDWRSQARWRTEVRRCNGDGCPVPQGGTGRCKFKVNGNVKGARLKGRRPLQIQIQIQIQRQRQRQRQQSRRDAGATKGKGAQLKLAATNSRATATSKPLIMLRMRGESCGLPRARLAGAFACDCVARIALACFLLSPL